MKTPDEIKKGLECCTLDCDGNMYTDCSHCPYYLTCAHCDLEMHVETLAYIQTLEQENFSLKQMLRASDKHFQQLEAKAGLVDQYRWERDVAIGQLEQLGIGFGEKVNGKLPHWISVEERLPEDGQPVIVFATHTDRWSGHWHAVMEDCWCGGGWDANCDTDIHKVTHWMPLPEPPEEE